MTKFQNRLVLISVLLALKAFGEPRISSIQYINRNNVDIEYLSTSGKYYILEEARSIKSPFYIVEMQVGTGNTNLLHARVLTSESGFYRLREMPIDSRADSDGDGLPDVYELGKGPALDPANSSDASLDFDGDGITNLSEFSRGWDPLSTDSPSYAARSRIPEGPIITAIRYSSGVSSKNLPSMLNGSKIAGSKEAQFNFSPKTGNVEIPNLLRIRPEVSINDTGVVAFIAETLTPTGATNSNIYVTRQLEDGSWETAPVMTDGQSAGTYVLGPGLMINNSGQIGVRRAVLDRTMGMNIVTSYAEVWNGNVFGGSNRGLATSLATGSGIGGDYVAIRNTIALNNRGTMAFHARKANSYWIGIVKDGFLNNNSVSALAADAPLSLSDAETIVLRRGDSSGNVMVALSPRMDASKALNVAGPSNSAFVNAPWASGFSSVGRAPGVSDDGRIVVFYANFTGPTNEIIDAIGPGIFAAINTNAITAENIASSKILRVAGLVGNGYLDPGEMWNDFNTNGIVDVGEDEGIVAGFNQDAPVRANNEGYIVWESTVLKPSEGRAIIGVKVSNYNEPRLGNQCVAERAKDPIDGVSFDGFLIHDALANGVSPYIATSTVGRPPGEDVLKMKLVPIALAIDANHDGKMTTFEENGDGKPKDQTSESRPYQFWVNSDFDRYSFDDQDKRVYQDSVEEAGSPFSPGGKIPDFDYRNASGEREIPTTRDLYDFARLWISGIDSGVLSSLPVSAKVWLSWGDIDRASNERPSIDLFIAADEDGGIGYLKDSRVAGMQVVSAVFPCIGRLKPGQRIQLNGGKYPGGWVGDHLIWCGAALGSGALTLTIEGDNGEKIGETKCFVQIKDIKEMYERWTLGDGAGEIPSSTARLADDDLISSHRPFKFAKSTEGDEGTPYILFVHGWNMERWVKDRFAETAFKRLYWQGFQGRFGLFRWPTDNRFDGDWLDLAFDTQNYDRSEFVAWLSAAGLKDKLVDLDSLYPNRVFLLAHSMGNVVAGEALRLLGDQKVVNTYIASQAAVPAHAYDGECSNLINFKYGLERFGNGVLSLGPTTPNIYKDWFAGNRRAASRIVNYFNPNDFALADGVWCLNQAVKPNDSFFGSFDYEGSVNDLWPWSGFYYASLGGTPVRLDIVGRLSDRYSAMAFAAESYSRALGSTKGVKNVDRELDLRGVWGNDPYNGEFSSRFWHSAEFRGDTAEQWGYWFSVVHGGDLGFGFEEE